MSISMANMKSSAATKNNKVFVIGLDGGTFDLVTPWVKEGKLPNLGKLMQSGSSGDLRTTIQPLTGSAWTSFMTGKNPGKHGIFDFIRRVPESYKIQLVDSGTRDANSIWKILSQHQRKVAVVNIPLNYPPEAVNGIVISWMDAPGVDKEFTYPPELYKEIKQNVGEYIISVNFSASLDAHIRDLHRMTDNHAAVALYLMENHSWDFFITLFSATDLVQHAFWKYMDPSHPQHDPAEAEKYGNTILGVYQRIDAHIGQILEKLGPETTVFIISDHGSGPLRKVVNLNRWLEQNGWLAFADESQRATGRNLGSRLRGPLLRASQFLYKLFKKAPTKLKARAKRILPGLSSKVESLFLSSTIDWSRTQAFALGAYGYIWINVKGREPQGTVAPGQEYDALRDQIIERLMQLRDPDTGEIVVEKVHKREELYNGPYVMQAPELIVQWKDYAYYSRQRFGEREKDVFQTHLARPLSSIEMNGYHRLNGMLIIKGQEVIPGQVIDNASIMDLAPTILYLLGVPIPDDMDGKVLIQAFSESFLNANPIRYQRVGIGSAKEEVREVYNEEEADKIKERLKGLGYL